MIIKDRRSCQICSEFPKELLQSDGQYFSVCEKSIEIKQQFQVIRHI